MIADRELETGHLGSLVVIFVWIFVDGDRGQLSLCVKAF